MELHLADNSSMISSQIVHLSLVFAYGAMRTVEFWLVPVLNHTMIFGMPFLHNFNSSIDWQNQTIIW